MPISFLITFLLAFAVGPLIVLWLMRRPSEVAIIRALGLATVILVVAAISAPMMSAPAPIATFLLWASWVTSMAVMGHVMRLVFSSPGAQRWTAAGVATGAALPWFGILIARAVAV